MPTDKSSLGARGEERAAAYLISIGYTIVARNYRTRFGEIDIIARDGEDLVFVEVKSRRNTDFGAPAEAVDYRKVRKIVRTAQWYVMQNELDEPSCRFDIAEVSFANGRPVTVEIIKGAFMADE